MPTFKEKMKTMTGYCPGCGERIMDTTKSVPKPLPNCHEHYIVVENKEQKSEHLLKVSVCVDCKKKLGGKDAKKVAETILNSHTIFSESYKKYRVVESSTTRSEFDRKKKMREHYKVKALREKDKAKKK